MTVAGHVARRRHLIGTNELRRRRSIARRFLARAVRNPFDVEAPRSHARGHFAPAVLDIRAENQ